MDALVARRDKIDTANAKRRITVALRHARSIQPDIASALVQISRGGDYPLPGSLGEFIDPWLTDTCKTFAAAQAVLADAHLDWDRKRQDRWLRALRQEPYTPAFQAYLATLTSAPPAAVSGLSDDDAAALAEVEF